MLDGLDEVDSMRLTSHSGRYWLSESWGYLLSHQICRDMGEVVVHQWVCHQYECRCLVLSHQSVVGHTFWSPNLVINSGIMKGMSMA